MIVPSYLRRGIDSPGPTLNRSPAHKTTRIDNDRINSILLVGKHVVVLMVMLVVAVAFVVPDCMLRGGVGGQLGFTC